MGNPDRERWEARYREQSSCQRIPSPFLVEHAKLISGRLALDVASGDGRHALWLARHGLRVHAIDISEAAARALAATARREGQPVSSLVADLETFPLPQATYDAVVNINFLHRPLLPHLATALRPGGVLVIETFTTDQARFAPPRNPAYLLERGELAARFAQVLDVLKYREGPAQREGRTVHIASLIARRA